MNLPELRLPPQDLEAEQSVIGSMMIDDRAIDDVSLVITADQFFSDAHQRMARAIFKLHNAGKKVDAVLLHGELNDSGQIEDVGGMEYMLEVMECVPHAAHATSYAEVVRDKFILRSLFYQSKEIAELVFSGEPAQDVLDKAESRIFGVYESGSESNAISIDALLIETMEALDKRRNDHSLRGIESGFVDLDKILLGFRPGEVTIIAARPSMGKTAFVCNLIAQQRAAKSCLFSLEQSKLELGERMLSIAGKIDGRKLKSGELEDNDYDSIMLAAQEVSEIPMFIDDTPGRSMSQITAIARRIQRKHGLDIIFIDYLQLIEPDNIRENREQQVARISRRLKFLARELEVPVIVLAQLNRQSETREDKVPRLSDLRESGSLEQDADAVLFLHRPSAFDPDDRPGETDIVIAKNRNGATGRVTLAWLDKTMRFGNLAHQPAPDNATWSEAVRSNF